MPPRTVSACSNFSTDARSSSGEPFAVRVHPRPPEAVSIEPPPVLLDGWTVLVEAQTVAHRRRARGDANAVGSGAIGHERHDRHRPAVDAGRHGRLGAFGHRLAARCDQRDRRPVIRIRWRERLDADGDEFGGPQFDLPFVRLAARERLLERRAERRHRARAARQVASPLAIRTRRRWPRRGTRRARWLGRHVQRPAPIGMLIGRGRAGSTAPTPSRRPRSSVPNSVIR